MSESEARFRVERDPVGERRVPAEALYGVQTLRARENFRVSGVRVHPALLTAYAEIKQAAAEANMRTGELDAERGFMGAAELAKKAIDTGRSVYEVVEEEGRESKGGRGDK